MYSNIHRQSGKIFHNNFLHILTLFRTYTSNKKQVLITSVSSLDHSYLQFTFDFMTLTQKFTISYFKQK